VTIVGSRRASSYGVRTAQRLGRELAAAGVTVVSGMALGIDAAAHRGALDGGGVTLAVLGGGPDVVYPQRHRVPYERILERGAAVSEHRAATTPRKAYFPARNRLMAALGKVVVIVEAAQPSGSLITADEAAKIGRSVGAVPGSVEARVAAGANALIADGAYVIRGARDVLDLLFGAGGAVPGSGLGAHGGGRGSPIREGPALEPELRRVLDLVESGAATVDRVALGAGLGAREAALALARLELLGYVSASALDGFMRGDLPAPTAQGGGSGPLDSGG
jgi:DNA processing protein